VKVLHIDDNQEITNLVSELIELQGFDYVVTNNPREGLNRIKNEKFDVVLLDMHMPELSGIDVIEELEREKILKDQKIVILSGHPFNYDQRSELLKKEGIHYCLKKPIEFNELLSAIKH
jgi:CheY-like chemotaxis protein